jgi:RimJ/RimL family protein N-acetyltransferase
MIPVVHLEIPTLETERLTLRPFRENDLTGFRELPQDPDVVRFVSDRRVPTLQETWRAIAGWIGHYRRVLIYGISRAGSSARHT